MCVEAGRGARERLRHLIEPSDAWMQVANWPSGRGGRKGGLAVELPSRGEAPVQPREPAAATMMDTMGAGSTGAGASETVGADGYPG